MTAAAAAAASQALHQILLDQLRILRFVRGHDVDLDRVPVLELLLADGTLELRLHAALVLDVSLQVAAGGVLAAALLAGVLLARGRRRLAAQQQGQAHLAGAGAGAGAGGRSGAVRQQLVVTLLLQQLLESHVQRTVQERICNDPERRPT